MSTDSIPYGRQEVTREDEQAVLTALRSDFLTQGPKVKEFEERFAEYVGSKYAVAVCNATAALHLCALVQGVGPGKRVITTPNTFVATANSVLYAGGSVEFADIDPKTYNLDPSRVEDLLKKNPRRYTGIIPVDFAGLPAQMPDFKTLADKYGLFLTVDSCHAPGATFSVKGNVYRSGGCDFSDLAVFSFHPVKHIAAGEGGMITTRSEELYKKLLILRSHGITKDPAEMAEVDGGWDYEMQKLGFNFRISDVLCALGTSQLSRANDGLKKRRLIASRYDRELRGLPLSIPFIPSGLTHAYHLYVIRTNKRKELFDHLKSRNIHAQVHYTPIHKQPYYVNLYGEQHFENAEKYYQECLSLPMFPSLTDEQQGRVIEAIREFYG